MSYIFEECDQRRSGPTVEQSKQTTILLSVRLFLLPGPVTYCVLLKGYGRQRRLGGVEATMREMKERGVAPDVVALNAAVDAFVRCDNSSSSKQRQQTAAANMNDLVLDRFTSVVCL